jgi:EpsI family protein
VLRDAREHLVLWYWYVVGEKATASDWQAELAEAWNAILHGRAESTLVVVSARAVDADRARASLRLFLESGRAAIGACVADAASCLQPKRE